MRITVDWTYDAPPEAVWAMTSSTDFQDRKCKEAGAVSFDTSVSVGPDSTVITTSREMRTDNIPDQLKAVVGSSVFITEVQTWGPPAADGSRTAQLEVTMKGQPVSMNGTVSAKPSGAQTVLAIDGDLKVRVPLFGGKIEKAIEPVLRAAATSEAAVGREWLASS